MIRRDYVSWWLRPAFLRPWGRKSQTLFAGPWVGEFGWELLNWQGFVRKLSRGYRRTVVCCRRGSEALYADFAHDFVFHDFSGTAQANGLREGLEPSILRACLAGMPPGSDHLRPLGYQPPHRQEFVRFGRFRPELRTDVVFHPRGRGFGSDRNWPPEKWRDLLAALEARGMQVACIGKREATLTVPGNYRDCRDRPLSEVMDLLASTRLVLGPSSGPMHLASLCGAPHLVWTDRRRHARGKTNRQKYEHWWNPLRTQVRVVEEEGFNPDVETVTAALEDFLPRCLPAEERAL